MAAQVAATPARAAARLGRSGWNAYSFNVDYRTGMLSRTSFAAVLHQHALGISKKQRHARCWRLICSQSKRLLLLLRCSAGNCDHACNIVTMLATGRHVDGKNTAGSYSALVVLETGAPFAGAFYVLPQYRAALDVRQGARVSPNTYGFRFRVKI